MKNKIKLPTITLTVLIAMAFIFMSGGGTVLSSEEIDLRTAPVGTKDIHSYTNIQDFENYTSKDTLLVPVLKSVEDELIFDGISQAPYEAYGVKADFDLGKGYKDGKGLVFWQVLPYAAMPEYVVRLNPVSTSLFSGLSFYIEVPETTPFLAFAPIINGYDSGVVDKFDVSTFSLGLEEKYYMANIGEKTYSEKIAPASTLFNSPYCTIIIPGGTKAFFRFPIESFVTVGNKITVDSAKFIDQTKYTAIWKISMLTLILNNSYEPTVDLEVVWDEIGYYTTKELYESNLSEVEELEYTGRKNFLIPKNETLDVNFINSVVAKSGAGEVMDNMTYDVVCVALDGNMSNGYTFDSENGVLQIASTAIVPKKFSVKIIPTKNNANGKEIIFSISVGIAEKDLNVVGDKDYNHGYSTSIYLVLLILIALITAGAILYLRKKKE